MNFWLSLFFLLSFGSAYAEGIERISLPVIPDLQRADLYVLKLTDYPSGILVLSPGFDGNGKDLLQSPLWQGFARDHKLDLVGLSFASDGNLLRKGRGYYYPAQGSGQLLLDGIRQAFGSEVPLLLYGFSGGAHFTSGFAEWKPKRVVAWCAYSAEWWDKPVSQHPTPPGLVVCGEQDESYGASLTYFKQGRALGKPWLWLCAPKTGHSIYPPVEDFTRHYFAAILDGTNSTGLWVDIDLKTNAGESLVRDQPSLTGWLPKTNLLSEWQDIHQP